MNVSPPAAPRGPANPCPLHARRPRPLALGVLLALICAAAAHAQQEPLITPNYRDADIRELIDAVSQVTGRNFLVDPRVRAQVTLISQTPMSPDAFYQTFLSALSVNGFMATEEGDVTKIVPDANARYFTALEGEGEDFVTQVVVLENVGAAQLVPILRPLVPQNGHMAAHQQSNALIISDRASNLRRVVDIVRRMDRASAQEGDVIPLQNASATEVVRMLQTLNQAAQAGGAPAVQVIADPRTNSVLLAGPPATVLQYRAYIAFLDTPTEQTGDTEVRYLNYADAEDLAMKLQMQFGGTGAAPATTPEGGVTAGPNGGAVNVWADAGTNALVITAPARIRQDMMAIIDQIDIPRAQVKVDAIIVEISEEKAAELGVTWLLDGSDDDEAVGLTNFSNTTGGIIQLGAIGADDTPDPSAIPQGITLGVGRLRDTGTSWAAIIAALRGDSNTNIVSTPTIVTMDNEEAEIRVGQEVPFITGQFTNTGAAAGSVNPFQTIQREEVGTSLKITPQINEGSGVKLRIEQETSSISQGATGAVDLITNTRTITTSVFVEDGDVLVLGGLIDDTLRQAEQRVPGLGRIPGLGWLFRARNTERVKTNLMVFIRPTILRDTVDARFETTSKYSYLRELQRQQAQSPIRLMRRDRAPELPELPPQMFETPEEPPPDATTEEPPQEEPPQEPADQEQPNDGSRR
ncbi:MAG TPA: type II secretion system secretin GspD [Gammaproteobacteria bacterium]